MQIDEPGANAGSKHRINLPPAYRQLNDDGEAKQFEWHNEKSEKKKGEKNQTLGDDVKEPNVTNKLSKEKRKMSIQKVEKTKNKPRKVRTLLNNYFMSRRRFYKLMESKMDR